MNLVIFDLDGTLLRTNSFHQFALFVHLHVFPRLALTRLPGILQRRRLRRLTSEEFKDALLAPLAGQHVSFLDTPVQRFVERLRREVYPKAIDALRQHQPADRILVASGALELYARPLLLDYGIEEIVATRLERNGDRYTGRIERPEILGQAKSNAVEQWIEAQGGRQAFESITFYTDCITDKPLLERVHHPIIVNQASQASEQYGFLDWK